MNNATLKLFRWSLKQVEAQLAELIPRAEDYRQVIHKEEARRATKATSLQAHHPPGPVGPGQES